MCAFVQSRAGPILTSSVFLSEVVQTVTQLFLVLLALHCAVSLSPLCGSAEDTGLLLYVEYADIPSQHVRACLLDSE